MRQLNDQIEALRSPTGLSKKSPARTCLDLYLAAAAEGRTVDNGMYWIDPNGGCEADAIEVKCDFTTFSKVETCVYPSDGQITLGNYADVYTGEHQWWSEMDAGMPIGYDPTIEKRVARADYSTQLTFLRLLATQVRQKISYECNEGIADIKLRGTGDAEFTMDHPHVTTVSDSCNGSAGQAVFEIKTSKTADMPIRDIASMEVGRQGQEFGFSVGAVCFS